jgi:hypothetical protein
MSSIEMIIVLLVVINSVGVAMCLATLMDVKKEMDVFVGKYRKRRGETTVP